MGSKTTRFKQVFVLGLATACFCSVLCGCGKASPHSERRLVAFVEEIDEDATLDYESGEALDGEWGENCIDYRYDAEIGGIDCYVVDRYYKNFDNPLYGDRYEIETDYTYRLCTELWDDVRVNYPSVDPLEEENDYGETARSLSLALVGGPYEINGRMVPGWTYVYVYEDAIDEDLFNEYWNFYCDLKDAMEDYPEFGVLQLSVYEGDTSKRFYFSDTTDDEYDEAYENYFGQ